MSEKNGFIKVIVWVVAFLIGAASGSALLPGAGTIVGGIIAVVIANNLLNGKGPTGK